MSEPAADTSPPPSFPDEIPGFDPRHLSAGILSQWNSETPTSPPSTAVPAPETVPAPPPSTQPAAAETPAAQPPQAPVSPLEEGAGWSSDEIPLDQAVDLFMKGERRLRLGQQVSKEDAAAILAMRRTGKPLAEALIDVVGKDKLAERLGVTPGTPGTPGTNADAVPAADAAPAETLDTLADREFTLIDEIAAAIEEADLDKAAGLQRELGKVRKQAREISKGQQQQQQKQQQQAPEAQAPAQVDDYQARFDASWNATVERYGAQHFAEGAPFRAEMLAIHQQMVADNHAALYTADGRPNPELNRVLADMASTNLRIAPGGTRQQATQPVTRSIPGATPASPRAATGVQAAPVDTEALARGFSPRDLARLNSRG